MAIDSSPAAGRNLHRAFGSIGTSAMKLAQLINPPAEIADGRTARRIYLVNIIALCGAATCFFFVGYNLFQGQPIGNKFVLQTVVSGLLFLSVIFVSRCRHAYAPGLLLVLVGLITSSLAVQGGRADGTHFFLLAIGPLLPLFFGSRRVLTIVLSTTLAVLAFLAIEFTVPSLVVSNLPWLPQMRDPFTEPLDIDFDDTVFILSMFAFQAILTTATLVTTRMAENAEAALQREYARSELLLQSLLPRPIATRLKDRPDVVIADEFELVTVLFADVVNFTPHSSGKRPEEIVTFLTRIFGEFDVLAEKHGLEKIKTIGDAYMVAGGLPERGGDHTSAVADMALDMIAAAERLTAEFGEPISVRIGFHAGPAVAGVIGRRKPFYDVWGDTINVAARMESSGAPGRIQITPEVKAILGSRFVFEERGTVEIKGKGPMSLYYLNGRSD